jgi:hypothetical protein
MDDDLQRKQLKILAVATAGGHWIQLRRMTSAFDGHRVVYVTTSSALQPEVEGCPFFVVGDASRWNKMGLVRSAANMIKILLQQRPDIVVSTGAAPGLFGIIFGKILGAQTIWVDSVANAETLSMSGKIAGRFSDLWLTQWEHLQKPGGPDYVGSVL